MSPGESRDLVPDKKVLSEIFPTIEDLDPSTCQVISNTWTTCTFLVEFNESCPPNHPTKVIVRLEEPTGRSSSIEAIQRLAQSCLGKFVPLVLSVGATINSKEKDLDYIVTEYIPDTIVLEDVWHTIGESHQRDLLAAVVTEMQKLQKLEVSVLAEGLSGTPFETKATTPSVPSKVLLGGPAIGYFPDVKGLLHAIIKEGEVPGCKLLERENGIALQSTYEDLGGIELSQQELEDLASHTVLCHNDIEPRNILVKEVSPGEYQLAAIIDWEMAGLFPFSYEYGLKDVVLGSSNIYFSWYTLYKRLTVSFLPPSECHEKLIKALRIIYQSRERGMAGNVGVLFQKKWVQREQVEESTDVREGWVRKAGAEIPAPFTKKDQDELELEALKELGII